MISMLTGQEVGPLGYVRDIPQRKGDRHGVLTPKESLNLVLGKFPQVRTAQDIVSSYRTGGQTVRSSLGDPRLRSGGAPIRRDTGVPGLGELGEEGTASGTALASLFRFLGIPTTEYMSPEDIVQRLESQKR
jgi:hypothetical protein